MDHTPKNQVLTSKIDNFLPLLAILGCLGFSLCQWLIFIYAPVEAQMGVAQKIFYFHLPFAWWSFMSFFLTFVASILYLYTRNFFWDTLAVAAVEVGVVFCTLALITGSIWARHSWNTWWTWDPRLTTSLVLWFIYTGYLIIRGLDFSKNRLATVSAVLGIIAFLDVPLVFFSARLWRTVHPAVFASQGGGLEPEMKLTIFICLFLFFFFWLALVLIRQRQKTLETYLDEKAIQISLDDN